MAGDATQQDTGFFGRPLPTLDDVRRHLGARGMSPDKIDAYLERQREAGQIMDDARRGALREDLRHVLADRQFAAELRQLVGLT